jgi:hypothetical protein
VKDGIGSIEDHEFLLRLWDSSGRALYVPEIVVVAPVDLRRLSKRYHRRWHYGHGHFHAVMTETRKERSPGGGFGVPAWQFRQCLGNGAAWLSQVARGKLDEAFLYETRMRFFWGFFQTSSRSHLRQTFSKLTQSGTDRSPSRREQPTRVP